MLIWHVALCIAVAAVPLYLFRRKRHIQRLRAAVLENNVIPSARILSWSEHPSPTARIELDPSGLEHHPEIKQTAAKTADEVAVRSHVWGKDLTTTAVDAAVSSLPSLYHLSQIDWNVVEALKFSSGASHNLDNFTHLKDYLDAHYFKVDVPDGFLRRLHGYVGEQIARDVAQDSAHRVEFPETPNQPGYDMLVDGDPVQVKVGKHAAQNIGEHFEKYPDIPVVTDPEAAAQFADSGLVDGMPELAPDNIDQVTDQTLDGIDGLDGDQTHGVVPIFTAFRSGIRELELLVRGNTDLEHSAKNVGLDIAGVGIGGTIGAIAGAGVGGALFGPSGVSYGEFLGGLAGAAIGKAISNEVKYTPFKNALAAYQNHSKHVRECLQARETEKQKEYAEYVEEQERALSANIEEMKRTLGQALAKNYSWFLGVCTRFVKAFPGVIDEVMRNLQAARESEMKAVKRSGWIRRTLWPTYSDVHYDVLEEVFAERLAYIELCRRDLLPRLAEVPERMSPVEAIGAINSFIRVRPFESHVLDSLASQLNAAYTTVNRRKAKLEEQIAARAQAARKQCFAAIHRKALTTYSDLAQHANEQIESLRKCGAAAHAEAKRVGIKLGGADRREV